MANESTSKKAGKLARKRLEAKESQLPSTKDLVKPYMEQYTTRLKELYEAETSPIKSDDQIKTEIKQEVLPDIPRPERISLRDTYTGLVQEQGIQDLEGTLNELKGYEDNTMDVLRERKILEENKVVPVGVIAGRIQEVDRQEMRNLDFIRRQINRVVDELDVRYKLVDTIMNLTKADYEIAVDEYNNLFSQNMSIYNAFRTERAELVRQKERQIDRADRKVERSEDKLFDLQVKSVQEAREEIFRDQDIARSNLQIYSNLVKSGNIEYSALDSKTKAQISKLEAKSGLGVGFLKTLRSDNPDGEIKSITTRSSGGGKYADIIIQDKDGKIRVESRYLGGAGSGDGDGIKGGTATAINLALQDLYDERGRDGFVSPNAYRSKADEWVRAGFKVEDFYSGTRNVVNPDHFQDYNVPQKYISGAGQDDELDY